VRFLPNEHAAIVATLHAHGVDPASVLFVKKRGRLHVHVPGRTDTFCFFREKSTKLDDLGRWHDRTDYFISTGKEQPCEWSAVISAFEQWLKMP
jgi:hypothetical protein